MNRQVPHNTQTIAYGLYGSGRVARHFAHFLRLKNHFVIETSRKTDPDFSMATQKLSQADVILVLVSDSAIEEVLFKLKASHEFASKSVVHFSGSLVTPLAPAFHPLMTFGPKLYSLEHYETIGFVVDPPKNTALRFEAIFPTLNNPHFFLDPSLRARYHALCVLSGNFTTLLWQRFFNELETTFRIPKEISLPYLIQITHNLIHNPEHALTGPLARNDLNTLSNHLNTLEGDALQKVYLSMIELYHSYHQERPHERTL